MGYMTNPNPPVIPQSQGGLGGGVTTEQFVGGLTAAASLTGLGNLLGAGVQGYQNKKLAAFQHAKNMELLKYQLEWDSPVNQMKRFSEAGLNPNLIYGQGSPGNMNQAPQYPDIQSPDWQRAIASIRGDVLDTMLKGEQLELMKSQSSLNNQKTNESGVKQDLMRAQTDLTKSNPYMKPEYVNAMVMQLDSAARLKEQESSFMRSTMVDADGKSGETGFIIMEKQLELLYQKYNLGQADQQIKAQIIESKEFNNDILEVQKKWMTEKEVTPEHIRQGIMLLLTRLMGR